VEGRSGGNKRAWINAWEYDVQTLLDKFQLSQYKIVVSNGGLSLVFNLPYRYLFAFL
jgi:hypothetical protein